MGKITTDTRLEIDKILEIEEASSGESVPHSGSCDESWMNRTFFLPMEYERSMNGLLLYGRYQL